MVQNILHIVYREVRGLHQAAYILALFTFGSQLLALIRDRLFAHQFGASMELDIYYTAFRIPDLLYVLFASTLSVYVLIPFITERMEKQSPGAAQIFLSQFFSLFVFVYTACAFLAFLGAPQIATFMFPGLEAEHETLVLLMRILLIQPLLLGISSLYGVITQMEQRFVLYALSPLMYNIGIIVGLLAFYPVFGIEGIAWGVVLGALGHAVIQIPSVSKSPLKPHLTLSFNISDILMVLRTSLTRALTLSLHQLVLLALVGFATMMTIGSVSVFQFAYNLQSVPLAIIGVSYSVAAFPLLAQLYAEGRVTDFGKSILNALRHIIFWSVPAMVLFIVIRAQFVRVVLGSGAFDWNDTRLTAAVLALFALSLTAQATHLLLVRALYAVGNTRLPFFVTMTSSLFAICASFVAYIALLVSPGLTTSLAMLMRLEGVPGIEVLALPIGYSCALILHSTALFFLSRRSLFVRFRDIVRPLGQALSAGIVSGYVAYATLNYFVTRFTTDTLATVFMQGALAAISGIAAYMLVQRLFRNGELEEIYMTLRRKFSKQDVLLPHDEDTLAV